LPDFTTYGTGYVLDGYRLLQGPFYAEANASVTVSSTPALALSSSGANTATARTEVVPYVDTTSPLERRGDGTAHAVASAALSGAVEINSTMASSLSAAVTAVAATLSPDSTPSISVPWTPTGDYVPPKFVLPFREPIFNQGQASNAPLMAITAFKSQLEFVDHRKYFDFNSSIYYQSVKGIDNIASEGSTLEASVGVLTSYGYLANAGVFKLDDPFAFPVGQSYKMANVDEIKDALYTGRTVVLGIQMDDGFRGAFSEVLPEPLGVATDAHAFVVYGWDDDKETEDELMTGALYVKNSWGREWGEGGFAWMPYTYLDSYLFDAWCVDDINDVII